MFKNKSILWILGGIAVGIAVYCIWNKYKKKDCNCGGSCCGGPKVPAPANGSETPSTQRSGNGLNYPIVDPEVYLDPGQHFVGSGVYQDRDLTDITYGFNGLDDNSPTNLSVPLMARPEVITIAPFNQDGGVIKDYS